MIKQNSGFTLVELAIVIVIIGLLVAGVLQGKELIEAAKRNKVISDFKAYQAAFILFRDKYGKLPGDLNNAEVIWGTNAGGCPAGNSLTGTCNGNGNNEIDWTGGWAGQNEAYRLWQHLGLAKLIKGTYTGANELATSGAYYRAGINAPEATKGSGIWMFAPREAGLVAEIFNRQTEALIINNTGGGVGYQYTPAEMFEIDAKMDDGKPAFGTLFASTLTWAPNCATTSTPSTAEYNVTYQSPACIPYFALNL